MNMKKINIHNEDSQYNKLHQEIVSHKKGNLSFPDNKISRLLSGINTEIIHSSIYINRSVDDLNKTDIELKTKFFNKENVSKFKSFKNSFSKSDVLKVVIPTALLSTFMIKRFSSQNNHDEEKNITSLNGKTPDKNNSENKTVFSNEDIIENVKDQIPKLNKSIELEDKIILDKSEIEYDEKYSDFNN